MIRLDHRPNYFVVSSDLLKADISFSSLLPYPTKKTNHFAWPSSQLKFQNLCPKSPLAWNVSHVLSKYPHISVMREVVKEKQTKLL